jgi:NAD(P)-dependent dehydrogenase (short-subunit alcohol dehydrogenase family)
MKANYIGAAITTLAFIPLLQTSPKQGPAKIVIVSSALGSAGVLPHLPPSFKSFAAGYSASKAAINMWARKAAFDLASEGSAGYPREGGWAVGIVRPCALLYPPLPRPMLTPLRHLRLQNHPGLVRTDVSALFPGPSWHLHSN